MNLRTAKSQISRLFVNFHSIYLVQPLFNACFYGVKFVFALYAARQFSLSDAEVVSLFAIFMSLCYGTSLIGGHIAAQWLGAKDTVTLGGTLMVLGLLCLLSPSLDLCFLGLALAALGSGCFKPNLLTAVGLLFDKQKDKAYSNVYIAMNLGMFFFLLLCSLIQAGYGERSVILFVTLVLLGITGFYYWVMRSIYNGPGASRFKVKLTAFLLSVVAILYALLKHRGTFHETVGAIVIICGCALYLGKIFYQCNSQERKGVRSAIGYLVLFVFFAAVFEQFGNSIMLFYQKAVDLRVMGFGIAPSFFSSLNPFFVTFAIFLMGFLSRRHLEKTRPMNGFTKSGYGFLLSALSLWVLAWGVSRSSAAGSFVSPFWIMSVIFLHALGEVWVVPVGLSQISQNSPRRFASVMMSFWTMAVACAHYLGGIIAKFSVAPSTEPAIVMAHYQAFFTYLGCLPFLVGVSLLAYRGIKPRMAMKQLKVKARNFG